MLQDKFKWLLKKSQGYSMANFLNDNSIYYFYCFFFLQRMVLKLLFRPVAAWLLLIIYSKILSRCRYKTLTLFVYIFMSSNYSPYGLKARVHLNGIFAPLNTGLVQISRSRFKQSKNSTLKTWIYVIGCFVNFLGIFGYIWVEIVFLKGLERFREIRKIENLMKFKN